MDYFGLANAATHIHGILHNRDTVRPETSRSRSQVSPPGVIPADKFIDYFSGIMDNMESAATNNKDVIEQLVTTTTMQYVTTKALLQELKPHRGSNNSGCNPSSDHTPYGDDMRKSKKHNATLHHAILKGWAKGRFFSSHGRGVPAGHDSRICPDWKPGHAKTDTRENTAGLAQYSNKVWDDSWT